MVRKVGLSSSLFRWRVGAPTRALLRSLLMGAVVTGATAAAVSTLAACTDERDPQTHVERLSDPLRRPAGVDRLLKFFADESTKHRTAKHNVDNPKQLEGLKPEEVEELKAQASGQKLKELLDVIVQPLNDLAVAGELDPRQQAQVLTMLAESQDPRAMPALTKAVDEYRPDGRTPDDADNAIVDIMINVLAMARAGKLESAEMKAATLKLFKNLEAFSPKGQNKSFYRIMNSAMVTIADPAWEGELITMIKVPIASTQKKVKKSVTNQIFWQLTASEVLGKLKSKKAVRPLMEVVLTPFKVPVHSTAINALIKIGKPAIGEAVKLLNGENQELIDYAAAQFTKKKEDEEVKINKAIKKEAKGRYKIQAVIMLAFMGTEECTEPMLAALKKGDGAMKGLIARELAKLPASDKVTAAFKKTFDDLKLSTKTPDGGYAKEGLAGSVETFFDIGLGKWLAGQLVDDIKGEKADVEALRQAALATLIKSSDEGTWANVEKIFGMLEPIKASTKDKYFVKSPTKKTKDGKPAGEEGPFTEKAIVAKIVKLEVDQKWTFRDEAKGAKHGPLTNSTTFQAAMVRAAYRKALNNGKKVLDECKSDAKCYAKKITSPEGQNKKTEIIGLKSVFMAAALGGPGIKPELIAMLPKIQNSGIRSQVAFAIDRLSPKGDPAAVKTMQDMVNAADATRIQSKVDAVKGLKQFIYRLEARQ